MSTTRRCRLTDSHKTAAPAASTHPLLIGQNSATRKIRGTPTHSHDADEYARKNGLTVDSLLNDAWTGLLDRSSLMTATIVQTETGELIEGNELPECLFRSIIPIPEQLQISSQSLNLIQQAWKADKEEKVTDLMTELLFPETTRNKSLKLETPLLRSDHDMDCRRLAREIKTFQKGSLPDHRLPLFPTEDDKGEGLVFTRTSAKLDKAMVRAFEKENMKIRKETMQYLYDTLNADWTAEDQRDYLEIVSTYNGIISRDYMTPPLSPPTYLPKYLIPDDETCEIPEPIDASLDLELTADIEAADKKLLAKDEEFWTTVVSQDVPSPDRYDNIDVSEMIRAGELPSRQSSDSPRPLTQDLKVEVPLMPDDNNADMMNIPARVMDPEDLSMAMTLVSRCDTLPYTPNTADGDFADFLEQKAIIVKRSAEQEELQALDATARVPIPVMDFSLPRTDWDENLDDASIMFEWIQETSAVDWRGYKWPSKNKLAEQRMVWVPLAHMGEKKLVSEEIEIEPGILASFLERIPEKEVVTSVDCINKQQGLLMLREEDDGDDEIMEDVSSPEHLPSLKQLSPTRLKKTVLVTESEAPTPVSPDDLTTLLGGRKRQLDELMCQRSSQQKQVGGPMTISQIGASDIISSSLLDSTNVLRSFVGEYTDFEPLVENYIEMNYPKKPKLTHSRFFGPAPNAKPDHTTGTPQPRDGEPVGGMLPPPKLVPAVAPEFTPPNTPPKVIVSSAVSKLLTIQLEKLLPGILLIERDYDKHRPHGWYPGLRSPNADEADIILSPATGIMMTTMVRLRQKPLPGKTGQLVFRNVVENVATRHERLVILVSEGNKNSGSMSLLSQSDAKALGEFHAFTVCLPIKTYVLYVGGGIETLAKWVAATICKYAHESLPVHDLMLPVETNWEMFLRRAGMNVCAAQVILGHFEVPDEELAIGGEGLYGLPRFLVMTSEERVEMFGNVLGGRRLLDRVSRAIGEPWGPPQAVNGVYSQQGTVFSLSGTENGRM
ncbi:hypothetical protein B0T17DRAFT_587780 [Bombardia bombarda]|uniref:Uncharacterized protein n=1 Tax=Bombardia bombarda TaxID=252184 RepID=A0AA40CGT2_9PEZI|nr:hypothetical protein B0T17DRAFT_587780 [Bombardia bombarda]